MRFPLGVWPETEPNKDYAGKPVIGANGLPFRTPGHKLCRSQGKVVICLGDHGEEADDPDFPIPRYSATFLSWHRNGYALGMGETTEEALEDLAAQCSTDAETLRAYCEIR